MNLKGSSSCVAKSSSPSIIAVMTEMGRMAHHVEPDGWFGELSGMTPKGSSSSHMKVQPAQKRDMPAAGHHSTAQHTISHHITAHLQHMMQYSLACSHDMA